MSLFDMFEGKMVLFYPFPSLDIFRMPQESFMGSSRDIFRMLDPYNSHQRNCVEPNSEITRGRLLISGSNPLPFL